MITYEKLRRKPQVAKRLIVLVGVVVGLGIHLTLLIAMTFFYIPQPPESHYYVFTTRIAYSLSWLLINGGFAGYTAFLITNRIQRKEVGDMI